MTIWKNYYLAHTVEDALQTLALASQPACPIAGGTDLLLDIQQGRHPPIHTLVDVSAIPEMSALEIRRGRLFVGASVPLNQIVASPLIKHHAQALVEACALIGGPQVRNTATLGGNVAHALPAADGTIALLALDALAEVASMEGRRMVPLEELFLGPGHSALDPNGELLLGFYLPLTGERQGSAFRRVMRPQGVAIAILNMAAWLERSDGKILEVRLSAGPSGPVPRRIRSAEDALRGKCLNEESLSCAQEALLQEARFRTSPHRSSTGYRQHLSGVLLKEVLMVAWVRAGDK